MPVVKNTLLVLATLLGVLVITACLCGAVLAAFRASHEVPVTRSSHPIEPQVPTHP